MNLKKHLLLLAIFSFCCFSLSASTLVASETKHSYEVQKLKNGLEVITLESKKVPLVTIVLASKAGAMTETADINGLTHLWEHMFFKGNKRLPNQEAFNRRIRQLGIVYNGDTSAEKVRYYFTLPSAYLDEGLQFMADAISTPLLEEIELKKERQVVMNEYDRNASQPGFALHQLQDKILYGEKSHLRNPLGVRKIIETATRDQLLRIKQEVFVPSNSAIFVAGDFDTKKTIKLMEKHFGAWVDPKGWKKPEQNTFPPFPKTTDVVMFDKRARNSEIQLTFAGPKARANPKDSFAADILISLLNVRSGKFYKKFIDSGLSFSAGLGYQTQSQVGELVIYASSEPKKTKEVQSNLLKEVNEWSKPSYFSDEQLQDVKRALLIGYKHELNKPSAYVKTLAFWWAVAGLDYYGSYLDNLQSTSLADVREFVNRYLIKKNYLSMILISPEGAKEAGLKDNSSEYLKKFNIDAGA